MKIPLLAKISIFKHLTVFGVLAAILGIILIVFKINRRSSFEQDVNSFTPTSLTLIEERTGIVLPEGAKGLNIYYDGHSSIDPSFIARVAIPERAQQEFAEQLKKLPHLSGSGTITLSKRVDWWWDTSRGVVIVERIYMHKNDAILLLLCKESDRSFLYIEWTN